MSLKTSAQDKGDLYKVVVTGQYYAVEDGKKVIKTYELDFIINEHIKRMGALSAFRNALQTNHQRESAIGKMMTTKYPDYRRFRTHEIVEVTNLSRANAPVRELALMNRKQIIAYINKRGFPIEPDLYNEVSQLRQALRDYHQNPELFLRIQGERERNHGDYISMLRSMDSLNEPESAAVKTSARAKSTKHKPPVVVDPDTAYANSDAIQQDLLPDGIDYEKDGIPEFDQKDELEAILDGV